MNCAMYGHKKQHRRYECMFSNRFSNLIVFYNNHNTVTLFHSRYFKFSLKTHFHFFSHLLTIFVVEILFTCFKISLRLCFKFICYQHVLSIFFLHLN